MPVFSVFFVSLLLLLSELLVAGEFEPLAAIKGAAVDFVGANAAEFVSEPEIVSVRLDSRLKMKKCQVPLESFESTSGLNAGTALVGVRCVEPKWKLLVPVQIRLPAKVVVAGRNLSRGEIMQRSDLSFQVEDTAKLRRGYFLKMADVVGQKLKNDLRAGQVISHNKIARPKSIKRNQIVTLLAKVGSISVSSKGKALSSAATGEMVRVKNLSSGKTVSGRVIQPGLIEVLP